MLRSRLSAPLYRRVLKLARIIADPAGSERIQPAHIAEAIHLRPAAAAGVGRHGLAAHTTCGGDMAVRDLETEWLRVQIYRRMTPAERVEIAARMYEKAIAFVRPSSSESPLSLQMTSNTKCGAACCRCGLAELAEPVRRARGLHRARCAATGVRRPGSAADNEIVAVDTRSFLM